MSKNKRNVAIHTYIVLFKTEVSPNKKYDIYITINLYMADIKLCYIFQRVYRNERKKKKTLSQSLSSLSQKRA